MIPIFTTNIDQEAKKMVSQTLDTSFISEGERVKEFEQNLMDRLGLINPVALNSGTSALHLALVLAGIAEGDEVIIPAQTFVATGLVVLQQGARVVFADVNYNTGNIDIDSLKSKITSRTKAIIPVHWAGMPCDMDEISELAKINNLFVIEDAAHALGATYKGKKIGSMSDFTCFSFQAIKHVTTGDGGAICCLNDEKAQEAFTRRWFGIDRNSSTTSILGERQYNIKELGFKYHLNDFAASLGLANLKGFNDRLIRIKKIAALYFKELEKIPGLTLWEKPLDRESAWWLFGMHVEKRNDFIRALADRGVAASVIHQRIDRNSIFGGIDKTLENQRKFDLSQIHIPLYAGLSDHDVAHIVESIRKGW